MPAQKGRVQGRAHQLPAGDKGHVRALPHGEGLVHLEVFRHRIVHVLHGISSHPDVGWVVVLHQDFQQGLGEKPVAGQVDRIEANAAMSWALWCVMPKAP